MARLKVEIDPQSLDCCLCLGTVSDPRILPCGHTFCGLKSPENCLQKLDPRNAGTIKCPICQTDHQVRVGDVPPNISCNEILESLESKKQGKRMCIKHSEEIVMRCITDGKEVCVSCATGDHRGHDLEKIHEYDHKRLYDFWSKENAKIEDKQLICRKRKDFLGEVAEYIDNQRLQEDSLDNQLGNLKTRRDAITQKLASAHFNPDDEDLMALKEYMDQLESTSECHQEASEDALERSQQLFELVDSRAPTYCQNINKNPVPATTRPTPIPETIPGPSKNSTGAALNRTVSEGGSTVRGYVGRRTLPEENVSCTTNILALGEKGRHYILGLNDHKWEQWKGKRDDFEGGLGAICYKEKVYIIGGYRGYFSSNVDIFHIRESKWTEGPRLNTPRVYAATCFVESERSIYICGGSQSEFVKDTLNLVEKLELDENGSPVGEWRQVTPMKERRWECAAVAVGTWLFVTGGRDQNMKTLSSVEIIDTESNEWKYGPEMKKCRSDHAVEYYDGNIYAMGGNIGNERKGSCEKLDLRSWTWTTIKSMRAPRADFGSVVASGKIYVLGGFTKGRKEDDERIVEIYDPVTNKWSKGSRLPELLGNTRCVLVANLQRSIFISSTNPKNVVPTN